MNHYINMKDLKEFLDIQIEKLKQDIECKEMSGPDRDSILASIAAYQVLYNSLDRVFKGVGIILEDGYDVGYVLARKEKENEKTGN